MHDRPRLGLIRKAEAPTRNPCGPQTSGRRELRRRGGRRELLETPTKRLPDDGAIDDARAAVDRLLGDILSSSCDVVGAQRSFLLVSRDERSVEVCASHRIHPSEIVQIAFTRAASALRKTFAEARVTLMDRDGKDLPIPTERQHCCPTLICIPIESALQVSGALCLERRSHAKALTDLDLEILQALAAQAGNALAAVRTHDALSRLSASLDATPPA